MALRRVFPVRFSSSLTFLDVRKDARESGCKFYRAVSLRIPVPPSHLHPQCGTDVESRRYKDWLHRMSRLRGVQDNETPGGYVLERKR